MTDQFERRADVHDIATRVALVEQTARNLQGTLERIETKQDASADRWDKLVERIEERLESANASPAGRELSSRIATSEAAGVARDGMLRTHEQRIEELEEWRSETRGVVRFLTLIATLGSGSAGIVTILHVLHLAGW